MAKTTKTTTKKAQPKTENHCTAIEDLKKATEAVTIVQMKCVADRIWVNSRGDDHIASLAMSTRELIDADGKVKAVQYQPSSIYHTLQTMQSLLNMKDEKKGQTMCYAVSNPNSMYIQAKKGYKFEAMCKLADDGVHYNVDSFRVIPE